MVVNDNAARGGETEIVLQLDENWGRPLRQRAHDFLAVGGGFRPPKQALIMDVAGDGLIQQGADGRHFQVRATEEEDQISPCLLFCVHRW